MLNVPIEANMTEHVAQIEFERSGLVSYMLLSKPENKFVFNHQLSKESSLILLTWKSNTIGLMKRNVIPTFISKCFSCQKNTCIRLSKLWIGYFRLRMETYITDCHFCYYFCYDIFVLLEKILLRHLWHSTNVFQSTTRCLFSLQNINFESRVVIRIEFFY